MQFRLTLSLVAILFAVTGLSAQGLQLKLRGSYNFPASQSVLETNTVTDTAGNTVQTANIVSLGEGVTFGLDATYMFSENIGAQLGFQYLAGNRRPALVQIQPSFINITSEVFTRQGQVIIGGIVASGGDPINLYSRFGLLLPVFGTTTIEVVFDAPFLATNELTVAEVAGKFSVGFFGGFGAEYKLSDKIGLSLEAVFSSLRIKAGQSVLVEKTDLDTGESVLDQQPASVITVNYLDEISTSSNNSSLNPDFDNTLPSDELTYSSTYSNIAVQLGVSFSFGK